MLSGFMRACWVGWYLLLSCPGLSSCIISVWRTNVGGGWEIRVVGSINKREREAALLFFTFFFICGDLGDGRWRW